MDPRPRSGAGRTLAGENGPDLFQRPHVHDPSARQVRDQFVRPHVLEAQLAGEDTDATY
ncbi:hypothetical protein [Streptomyces sp. NPDC020951]|uniref:hypothetical protein n=1 Tax=Streptomyces sp. NPDC020951 TaxID=3365104 RepID=UPI0037979A9C